MGEFFEEYGSTIADALAVILVIGAVLFVMTPNNGALTTNILSFFARIM